MYFVVPLLRNLSSEQVIENPPKHWICLENHPFWKEALVNFENSQAQERSTMYSRKIRREVGGDNPLSELITRKKMNIDLFTAPGRLGIRIPNRGVHL